MASRPAPTPPRPAGVVGDALRWGLFLLAVAGLLLTTGPIRLG
jgi:hypothetical protein